MGPNRTGEARKRGPGEHLSPAEREELGFEAYELSVVKKWTYRQIAAKLKINKDTVKPLIEHERAKRRLEHRDQIADSAATYDGVEGEAWRRLSAFPDARASMVVVGLINNVLNARRRKDALYGHDAPKKHDVTRRDIDMSGLTDEQLNAIIAKEGEIKAILAPPVVAAAPGRLSAAKASMTSEKVARARFSGRASLR